MPSLKPIVPKAYNTKVFLRDIVKVKKTAGRKARKELEKTTRTWEGDKPKFVPKVKDIGDDMITIIDPQGNEHAIDKWSWLNDGVPPHPIRAKNPWGKLFFGRTDLGGAFVPKTKPGRLASMAGQDVDDIIDLHAPSDVEHPGIKKREWANAVQAYIMGFLSKEETKVLTDLATGKFGRKGGL